MANKIKSILDTEPPEESQYDGWTYFGDAGNKKEKVPYILQEESPGVSSAWWPMGKCWFSFMRVPTLEIFTSWVEAAIASNLIKEEDSKKCKIDGCKSALNFNGVQKLLKHCPLYFNKNLKRHFLSQVETTKGESMKKENNSIGKFDPKKATELIRKPMPIGVDESDGKDYSAKVMTVAPAKALEVLNFWYHDKKFRTHVQPDGSEWYCLADICKILGYKDAEEAFEKHCIEKRIAHKPEDVTKKLYYVSECDLNNLILRSNSPSALPFRKLITQEVMPALRKYSKYIITTEIREQILGEAKKALPVQGEQLEMFPITASGKVTFKKEAMDWLLIARKKLADKGVTFETYSDFLGYLIDAGVKAIK